jgi:hypothetical protein
MSFLLPRNATFSMFAAVAIAAGCGSDDTTTETTGQPSGAGGASTGGAAAGGTSAGGMGTGGTSTGGAAAGGMSAGGMSAGGGGEGGGACGAVGAPCNGSCPGNLTCYAAGGAGFCIPPAPDCGGFAGARCDAPTPVCMYLSSADFGPCGTQATKDCVCANSPGVISDC